jgi:hypothetical protein
MELFYYLLALVWGSIWAAFLQWTRPGWFLANKRTWLTVIVGVGVDLLIILGILSVVPSTVPLFTWLRMVAVFALSSVPIIARSIYNELLEQDEVMADVRKSHE